MINFTIDWINFTPYASFFGGILIGLSALLLMLSQGKIMGASGIISGLIMNPINIVNWRLMFVIGAVAGPLMLIKLTNKVIEYDPVSSGYLYILAAFFVGFGTSIGSGCTSGHGICGISLLSKRSLIAVTTFLVTGIITVFFLNFNVGAI